MLVFCKKKDCKFASQNFNYIYIYIYIITRKIPCFDRGVKLS